ncbi:MAG: peptidoglycan-binding domain-containing protein [Acidobacteriota bacterium]
MLHRTLYARLALVIVCLLVSVGFPGRTFPDAQAKEVVRPQKRRTTSQHLAQRRRTRENRSATTQRRRGQNARSQERVSQTRRRNARMRTWMRSSRERGYSSRRSRGRERRYATHSRGRGYARRNQRTTSYGAPAAPVVSYRPPRSLVIPEARTREIQEKLKEAGFYQGEITGQYDESTRDAMRNFQRANGLKETGTPTAPALLRLGLTKHTSEAGDTSAPPVQLPPPTDQPPD